MSGLSADLQMQRERLALVDMQIDQTMQDRLREMPIEEMTAMELRDRRVLMLRDYLDNMLLFAREMESRSEQRERHLMGRVTLLERRLEHQQRWWCFWRT